MKTHRLYGPGRWEAYAMPVASVGLDEKHGINETIEIRRHPKYMTWVEITMTDYERHAYCWLAVIDYFIHIYGIIPALEGINITKGGETVIL